MDAKNEALEQARELIGMNLLRKIKPLFSVEWTDEDFRPIVTRLIGVPPLRGEKE